MPLPSSEHPTAQELLAAHSWDTETAHGACGTERGLARMVAEGRLIRARRGRYVSPTLPAPMLDAARAGSRLDCVSLLAVLGIFVRPVRPGLHVQIEMGASRLPQRSATITAHWRATALDPSRLTTDVVEALVQAVRCQRPRDAIATLDSAWNGGWVTELEIAEVFARLPRRFRRLRPLLDRRAESGPETLVRLMLRTLGCHVDLQVHILGVGRVDLLVDGWLIVECDSRAHHDGWDAHRRDRRRDLVAASLGYTTVRPIAEDVLGDPERVFALLRAAVAHGRDRRASSTPSKRAS
ncbi:hypothetical protein LJR045_000650 [Microbacterium sp. LjRoot45]|uniref:hypothetical protein n=1 Tax=Microbacterium sp. LjRoot45 TaxID=3342329 RepID=UPI003ECEF945